MRSRPWESAGCSLFLRPSRGEAGHFAIDHSGGFALEPVVPRPSPGDSSGAFRIVSISARSEGYTAVVEGRPGSETFLRMHLFDRIADQVRGGDARPAEKAGLWDLHLKFEASSAPFVSHEVVVRTKAAGR